MSDHLSRHHQASQTSPIDHEAANIVGHIEQRPQANHSLLTNVVTRQNDNNSLWSTTAGPTTEDISDFGVWQGSHYRGRYWNPHPSPPPPPPPPPTPSAAAQSLKREASESVPAHEVEVEPHYLASPSATVSSERDPTPDKRELTTRPTQKRRKITTDDKSERQKVEIESIIAKRIAAVNKAGHSLARRQKKRPDYSVAAKTSEQRHIEAERELRSEKSDQKMMMQRQLCSSDIIAYMGHSMQSVSNARSSGLLHTELDILKRSNQALSMLKEILTICFKEEALPKIGGILHHFEPMNPLSETDPTERRIEAMREATEPFNLRDMRTEEEYRSLIEDILMPMIKTSSRQEFQAHLDKIDKEQGSRS